MGQSQGALQQQCPQMPLSEGFSFGNHGAGGNNGAEETVLAKLSSTTSSSGCTTTSRNLRNTFQQKAEEQQQRQSRSKSLEPKAAMEIRAIEHSKSARYGSRTSGAGGKLRGRELWNPDKAAAQLIGQQLQNPHVQQPNLQLLGVFRMRQFRKQSGQNDLLENAKKDAVTGLSAHQIQILQKIWERSPESEICDCARNIMAHLLRSNAQMYQFFDLLGLSDREIVNSSTFHRQSANFAIVLDFVLANLLDEIQKVCLALQHLGAQHSKLSWPIEPHHWALFTRCFEDNPPKEVFLNAEGHDLWKTMINFIVIQMRIGYDRASGVSNSVSSILSSPRLGAYRRPSEDKHECPRQKYTKAMRSNTMATPSEMDAENMDL